MTARKPLALLTTRSLRRYTCMLCDQRLDRMRRSPKNCSAFDPDSRKECSWHERLNAKPEAEP